MAIPDSATLHPGYDFPLGPTDATGAAYVPGCSPNRKECAMSLPKTMTVIADLCGTGGLAAASGVFPQLRGAGFGGLRAGPGTRS